MGRGLLRSVVGDRGLLAAGLALVGGAAGQHALDHHDAELAARIDDEPNPPVADPQPVLSWHSLQRLHVAVACFGETSHRCHDATLRHWITDASHIALCALSPLDGQHDARRMLEAEPPHQFGVRNNVASTQVFASLRDGALFCFGDGLVIERSVRECGQHSVHRGCLAAGRGDAAGASAGRHRNKLACKTNRSNRAVVRRQICARPSVMVSRGATSEAPPRRSRPHEPPNAARSARLAGASEHGGSFAVPAATWPCAVGPTRAGPPAPPGWTRPQLVPLLRHIPTPCCDSVVTSRNIEKATRTGL